jgi:hypothetical protein
MKRYLLGAVLVLVGLTMVLVAANTQIGSAQMKLHWQAGDGGGPIPTCKPGANCGPDDSLRQVAGDGGGPIPTCKPGANCGPDDTLRLMAGVGVWSELKRQHFLTEDQADLIALS